MYIKKCCFQDIFSKKKNTKTGTVIANDVKGLTTTFKTRKYTLLRPAKFVVTKKINKRKYKIFSFVRQKNQ